MIETFFILDQWRSSSDSVNAEQKEDKEHRDLPEEWRRRERGRGKRELAAGASKLWARTPIGRHRSQATHGLDGRGEAEGASEGADAEDERRGIEADQERRRRQGDGEGAQGTGFLQVSRTTPERVRGQGTQDLCR